MKQTQGSDAEDAACRWLQRAGLKMIARNFRCRLGELDLIMSEKRCLVFVEVRYRKQRQWGSAAESISPPKQKRLLQTAAVFLAQNPRWQQADCRFDAVLFDGGMADSQIHWQQNILQAE